MHQAQTPRRHDRLSTWLIVVSLGLALGSSGSRADEGMWTFEHAPLATIQQRHGVTVTPQMLARLQAASVHVGASASFVSAEGLLLTNHHVVEGCMARLSSAQKDLAASGFVATRRSDELRCPGFVARVLLRTEDVTARITSVAASATDDAVRNAARKATIASIEKGCSDPTQGLRCEVVSLYSGARYALYHYREWDDVRLAWAPEADAGFFGGDPDNFVYPRFALDAALMRVYEKDGQPHRPTEHLRPAATMPREGELLFVAGHPGHTERLRTVAQLASARDVEFPLMLETARTEIAALHAYAATSAEAARQAQTNIFGTENWYKASLGEYQALKEPALLASKRQDEQALHEAYRRRGLAGDPWAEVAKANALNDALQPQLWGLNFGYRTTLATAADLVALAYERGLPEDQRLAAYSDASLPEIERRLRADAPFYPALETVRLTTTLQRSLTLLGMEHAYMKLALAGRTPAQAAQALVAGTRLGERSERERLLQGGAAAIAASTDPLIMLAREAWPLRRALQLRAETEVETPIRRAAELIDQARFTLHGHDVPPDATNTLRLSFGPAKGYVSNGLTHPWKTTWGGWWDRADSFDQREPFKLAPHIDRARGHVDPRTPLDFVLTADIIGGNSGSPVVDARGELVGLIFDGNLEGLGGNYAYQDSTARAIAVHAEAILTALEKVYGAPALAAEMRQRP
jgi:hypothetical protein